MSLASVAYRCPLCRLELEVFGSGWQCPKRHSFDIAREGYVNLLPVNKKQSREPGDNLEMMTARRRFFDSGHYLPLQLAIAELSRKHDGPWLDIGCGEGWYSQSLQTDTREVFGIDISRPAIKMAAKRYPESQFAVASSYDLPFFDQSFTGLLNVFAPLEPGEARRLLKPGGVLLQVTPGPEHLFALKALLYEQPRVHEPVESVLPGFTRLSTKRLQTDFELRTAEGLIDLIQMTPYAWKLQTTDAETLKQALPARVGLDVMLSLYQA